jgi:hypothetical protein
LLALILPTICIVGTAYLASEYFGAPVGGLTRRGAWPERDYLWRAEQPALLLVANSQDLKNPDVVVIGDSFSLPNAWQSTVTNETGFKIKTYNYANNHNCYLPWIKKIGEDLEGQGKLVIIESIEHQFMDRFRTPERCNDALVFNVPPATSGVNWQWSNQSLWQQIDVLRQFKTLLHQLQLFREPASVHGNWVLNAPLNTKKLFSNLRSDRLLYLDLDEQRRQWTESDIAQAAHNLKETQDYLLSKGLRFSLLVVPDKVHVYEDALTLPWASHPATDLPKSMRAAGVNAFSVLDYLKKSAPVHIDLYMPNDDHLSPAGQIQLGKAVSQDAIFKNAILAR